ncbi:hypothetical protein [Ferrovibrio sp.]|uniref:hypothetical protein n=1 Tax=Ferrovibrio sp. TaxID=1917215 RepID=UPI001B75C8BA|nr:hypothetical protein [Ferrovibrio sp.]MBP7065344.1 hypothetical protein [Ferrovibrio sp.]
MMILTRSLQAGLHFKPQEKIVLPAKAGIPFCNNMAEFLVKWDARVKPGHDDGEGGGFERRDIPAALISCLVKAPSSKTSAMPRLSTLRQKLNRAVVGQARA